ncbi:hypothetical protein RND71_009950 [Anisodus tanguticus]|uniref:Uncharacterized protein n=1 Tax=Anisodus tanguticus TaxID=243964 RepID=A0AAE1SIS0_9SOLA|nr:hypothetical protein RND71_009950 [Anisodus tanguticus]
MAAERFVSVTNGTPDVSGRFGEKKKEKEREWKKRKKKKPEKKIKEKIPLKDHVFGNSQFNQQLHSLEIDHQLDLQILEN